MDTILKPVNIAGAILVVQVCLLLIMTFGVFLNRNHKKNDSFIINISLLLFLAIFSIIAVAITTDFYPVWSPILGTISLPTIERANAFSVLFVSDMLVIFLLIRTSGGAMSSPYTSILFMIPTLAIFLREPPIKFFSYAIIASLIYYFSFEKRSYSYINNYAEDTPSGAHKFVNLSCLVLGVITGYITRPLPI